MDKNLERYAETEWGASLEKDLRVGRCRHEFGIFEEGRLCKVFRTDVEEVISLIEQEARSYIATQEQEHPQITYQLKKLQWIDI